MGPCLSARSSVEHPPEPSQHPPPSRLEQDLDALTLSTDGSPLYVCTHDYDSRTDDDLSLKKGDLVHILRADDDGWWLARSIDTGKTGYIPSSYVAEHNSLEAEE